MLDDWMEALVVIARGYDFSWEDLSANLRITRQAAWSRWRDLAPDRTRDPAVIELLVGMGAERRLKPRATEHDVQEWVGAAEDAKGDRDAIARFVERRARERRAART